MRSCFIACIAKLFLIQNIYAMDQLPQQEELPSESSEISQNLLPAFLLSSSSLDSFFLESQEFEHLSLSKLSRLYSPTSTQPPRSELITPQNTDSLTETTYKELYDVATFSRKQHLRTCFNIWKKKYEKQQEQKWDILDEEEKWDFAESSHDLTEEQRTNSSERTLSTSMLSNTVLQNLQWVNQKIKSLTSPK